MRTNLVISALAVGLMVAAPAWAEPAANVAKPPVNATVPSVPGQGQTQGGMGQRHHERGEMFKKADKNGDGAVDKAEFLAQAEEHFAKMDKNGDGKLTKEDRPQRPEGDKGGDMPMMKGGAMPPHEGMMQNPTPAAPK